MTFSAQIGPSAEVLISDGARFVPCMKFVQALPPSLELACLNDTAKSVSLDSTGLRSDSSGDCEDDSVALLMMLGLYYFSPPTTGCPLGEMCGFGGIGNDQIPNRMSSSHSDALLCHTLMIRYIPIPEWWRFILPIFLHVGLIHLALNMAAQIIAGGQVEREMGSREFNVFDICVTVISLCCIALRPMLTQPIILSPIRHHLLCRWNLRFRSRWKLLSTWNPISRSFGCFVRYERMSCG